MSPRGDSDGPTVCAQCGTELLSLAARVERLEHQTPRRELAGEATVVANGTWAAQNAEMRAAAAKEEIEALRREYSTALERLIHRVSAMEKTTAAPKIIASPVLMGEATAHAQRVYV